MSPIVLVFFTVYGGVHVYAFLRARSALGFGTAAGVALAAFMLVMVMTPFIVRVLENQGYDLTARTLAYVGYLWLAVLFLFFCSSVALDVVNLLSGIVGRAAHPRSLASLVPVKSSFAISVGLSVLICLYGYFIEAKDIRTEHLTVETTKLPAGVDRLRIVQISDVHLGLIVRASRLSKVMDIVRAEKPDIFISTGDLVDAQINQMPGLVELLNEVNPKYGKYAVTGNHEYYAGIAQALDFTKRAGFTLLRGEAVSNGVINIAGVDDPTGAQLGIEKPESDVAVLSRLPRDKFTLFLKHRPVIDKDAVHLFDLQLSGHTHKGQIYPFRYVSEISYPLNSGKFVLPGGAILYTSRGTGTWGPPVRFLAPPEVTVIDIVRKKGHS